MRGLEKNRMKRDRQTDSPTDGHRDSMKEPAKGRFFENHMDDIEIMSKRYSSFLQEALEYKSPVCQTRDSDILRLLKT